MSRKPHFARFDSPEALDNLAASYRMVAKTMEVPSTRQRMLKMAEKFDDLAKLKRLELETRRKEWQAW